MGNDKDLTGLISDRVRHGYLDRLEGRATRMKRLLMERRWGELYEETQTIQSSAKSFEFGDLSDLAAEFNERLGKIVSSRQPLDIDSKRILDKLMEKIDTLLVERTLKRDTFV